MSAAAPPPDPAAIAAAQAAFRQFSIEAFTLLAVGILVTILRTYARIRAVGIKRLEADDYLVWFAAVRVFLSQSTQPSHNIEQRWSNAV